ncbi:MAG: hypothetical protein ACP5HK_04665 [Acidilobus sp.]
MSEARGTRASAYLVIALAALVVVSNAIWYIAYNGLSGKYARLNASYGYQQSLLKNVTARLYAASKLLNVSVKTIQAYKNLTAALNVTLMAMEAGKLAAVTNVSLQLDVESIKLMTLATSLVAEANQTTDPLVRQYLVTAALNATNATEEGIKALAFLGSYMGANSTYFEYLGNANVAVEDIASLAYELKTPSTTVPTSAVTSDLTQFVSNVLSAERALVSLGHSQSTS